MTRLIISISILLFFFTKTDAQYFANENKKWVFGYNAGIDFSSGLPVPFYSNIYTREGSASVSDAAGNLLFYTDGTSVFNRTGAYMPSGSSIVSFPTVSTGQAAVIAPVVGNPNQYYVFSLESAMSSYSSRLAYSVVDMTLDGGNGDVLPTLRGIQLDSSLSEKMISVRGLGCNTWLITRKRDRLEFVVYNINSTVISSPVISVPGVASRPYVNTIGVFAATTDGRKIACCCEMCIPNGLELFDFDPASGLVSGRVVLDSIRNIYGVEFSPDNSKLYAIWDTFSGVKLLQYDVSLSSPSAIISSEFTVVTANPWAESQMRLAPDGKIYINRLSDLSTEYLDVINHPNLSGISCGYVSHAVALSPGSSGFIGMPSIFVPLGAASFTYSRHDTAVCITPGDSLRLYPYDTALAYLWSDTSWSPSILISYYGTYWVQESNSCIVNIDTIVVTPLIDTFNFRTDTTVCVLTEAHSMSLAAPLGTEYLWYNGGVGPVDTIMASGVFWVSYTDGCTRKTDTFHVAMADYPLVIEGADTFCVNGSGILTDPTPGGVWTSDNLAVATIGSTNGVVSPMASGTVTFYYTTASGCAVSKSVFVKDHPCNTSVADQNLVDFSADIYPIPANQEFVVATNGLNRKNAALSIFDMAGRLLKTIKLTAAQTTVEVHELPDGVYTCRIDFSEGPQVVRKLVIKH